MSKILIKKKIREYDTELWRKEMLNKSTLHRYRKKKYEIKEEKRIDNSLASMLWFRGRTNTMKLNIDHRFIKKGSTVCNLCEEDEDMSHFLFRCKKLEKERDYPFMKRNEAEDDEVILEIIFFWEN